MKQDNHTNKGVVMVRMITSLIYSYVAPIQDGIGEQVSTDSIRTNEKESILKILVDQFKSPFFWETLKEY